MDIARQVIFEVFDEGRLTALAAVLTAVATVLLAVVTWVLARETKVLSRATSQAHVTFTIEPNQWALLHVDLVVANSGNAAAYDITAEFEPPLPQQGVRQSLPVPLRHISVLRPGQVLMSYLAEFEQVKTTFNVRVSWKASPTAKRRQELRYELAMADLDGLSSLGARTPMTQIAEQLKHIREDWQYVARGSHRLKADVFTRADREDEAAQREGALREALERSAATKRSRGDGAGGKGEQS